MDLENSIRQIVKIFSERGNSIQTEEATKMSLIAPLIQALGYNIFDPSEVVPEFIADVGTKKGEKIDYAILSDGKPIMIIECKWSGASLTDENKNQLIRYFVTLPDTKIAILTNGLVYQFYTDIDRESQLDAKPYFQFDIREIKNHEIKELGKYAKPEFKIDSILSAATELKYTREIKRYIESQMSNPEEAFVRCVIMGIEYPGKAFANVVDAFKVYTKNALNQFLNEKLNERLESAMQEEKPSSSKPEPETADKVEASPDSGKITTQDEIDGCNIVRAILRKYVPVQDLSFRDAKSYSSVLYKNSNLKPICRFYFNTKANMQLALIGAPDPEKWNKKTETRVKLNSLEEIYDHEDALVDALRTYQKAAEEQ
ncbi:MAG: type I restriction enzyme HsdR N-terminal domain-containing protein [Synergistaceae bacterium]|jgi:hypothetical protein|nr:type I restriction enzyme HsdR N-terminal domain-containing protein [Synergistaceae bacterium]